MYKESAASCFEDLAGLLETGIVKAVQFTPNGMVVLDKHVVNRGPFMVFNGELAIPQYCIPIVLKHCSGLLTEMRGEFRKFMDNCQNQTDPTCEDSTFNTLENLTKCILVLNGEHNTAWGIRKELLTIRGGWQKELDFINILCLSKATSKRSGVWYHRQWLINNLSDIKSLLSDNDKTLALQFYKQEQEIIAKSVLRIYPRNYYAQVYRYYLFDLYHKHFPDFCTKTNSDIQLNFWSIELAAIGYITSSNCLEYGNYNYAQRVFQVIFQLFGTKHAKEVAVRELRQSQDLMDTVGTDNLVIRYYYEWCKYFYNSCITDDSHPQ